MIQNVEGPNTGADPQSKPVAVVTGAARGLGAAFVEELAARGYAVAGCSRSGAAGAAALFRTIDVSEDGAVEAFAAQVVKELGPIALWINNAGILGPLGPIRDTTLRDWLRCLEVNVLGVVNGTRAFLRHRRLDEPATLANIASRAAVRGVGGLAAYSASKAAVIALTQSVAEEERISDVRAVVVVPPSTDTTMQDTLTSLDEDTFPRVAEWRERRASGGVWAADAAAVLILDRVLDRRVPLTLDLADELPHAAPSCGAR